MRRIILLTAGLVLLAGVASAQVSLRGSSPKENIPTGPAVPQPLPMKEFMRHVINPAAEAYWANSGIDDSEEGTTSRAPKDQAHWDGQVNHAAALLEAGNQLLAEGRRREDPVWTNSAMKLIKGGADGIRTARAKDEEGVFNAGSLIYEACYDCHGKYIVRPANSLYQAPLPK